MLELLQVTRRLRRASFPHLLDLFRLFHLLEVEIALLLRDAELQLHALLAQRLLVLNLLREVVPFELWEILHVPQIGEVRAAPPAAHLRSVEHRRARLGLLLVPELNPPLHEVLTRVPLELFAPRANLGILGHEVHPVQVAVRGQQLPELLRFHEGRDRPEVHDPPLGLVRARLLQRLLAEHLLAPGAGVVVDVELEELGFRGVHRRAGVGVVAFAGAVDVKVRIVRSLHLIRGRLPVRALLVLVPVVVAVAALVVVVVVVAHVVLVVEHRRLVEVVVLVDGIFV